MLDIGVRWVIEDQRSYRIWHCTVNRGHYHMVPHQPEFTADYFVGWRFWQLQYDRKITGSLGTQIVFVGDELPNAAYRLVGGQGMVLEPYVRAEAQCSDGRQPPCAKELHGCGIYAIKERQRYPMADYDYGVELAVPMPPTRIAPLYGVYEEPYQRGARPTAAGQVLGKVALWGRVWEHQWGYRAQYAYPQALAASPDMGEDARAVLDEVAGVYGVPVI